MAVTEVKLHSAGASGSAAGRDAAEAKVGYELRYRVKVDDATPSPVTVLLYFQLNSPSVPWIGDAFALGSSLDSRAVCTRVNPTYIENSAGWFEVVATFEDASGDEEDEEQKPDDDGNLTSNPLNWAHEIEQTSIPVSRLVEFATFRGFYNVLPEGAPTIISGKPHLKKDKFQAITNSALKPLNPTIEDEDAIKVFRITKFVAEYDDALYDNFHNTVNNAHIAITKPLYGFVTEVPQYSGLFRTSSMFSLANGVPHWRQTAEIYVNLFGWRRNLLDQGLEELLEPGDEDDEGNTLSDSDFASGKAYDHFPITGPDEMPVVTPVLLDGKGRRLDPGDEPVFGVWSVKGETDWTALVGRAW